MRIRKGIGRGKLKEKGEMHVLQSKTAQFA